MKKQKTHLNKMKPLYMLLDESCIILVRYLGVSYGSYKFEIIQDLSKLSDEIDRLPIATHLNIPKKEMKSGKITIRELTPAELILYAPKNKKSPNTNLPRRRD